jgi:hypothetical protein
MHDKQNVLFPRSFAFIQRDLLFRFLTNKTSATYVNLAPIFIMTSQEVTVLTELSKQRAVLDLRFRDWQLSENKQ